MSFEVFYAPTAVAGRDEIAAYLGQQSPNLGLRFLKAVEDTCAMLADTPEMASRHETDDRRLADLRVWSVKGFPNHLIFFRIRDSHLEIVQIIYGGRDLDKVL